MEDRNETTRIETNAQLQACELELCITRTAWAKLMGFCRATNLEVSGFMLLERDGDLLMVTDAFIVDQVCTGASTEMDSTAIAKLQMELFKKKIIGQNDNVKLAHFHTHCTFNVFWSGTDMEMRQTLRKGTDYSVALVINHKGESLAAIDINGEFPMSISNLPVVILEDAEINKACKAEVEAKVKSPQVPAYAGYQYNGLDGMNYRPSDALRGSRRGRPRKNPDDPKWKEIDSFEPARYEITDEELRLGRRIAADDGIWSTDEGTFANVGGEIVKLEGPNGEPA